MSEDANVATQFLPGYSVLFDKGFDVQDLFLDVRDKLQHKKLHLESK